MTTPSKTTAPIADTRRAEVIADLNGVLVHLIDIAISAKQAHWNVQGPNFQGLHDLLDVVTDEVRTYYDDVAERLVAMGGTAHGTVQDISKESSFAQFPTDERKWEPLTKAMVERLRAMSRKLEELEKSTEDELVTQDLYITIREGLDKRAWMLEAHLR